MYLESFIWFVRDLVRLLSGRPEVPASRAIGGVWLTTKALEQERADIRRIRF